MPSYSFAEAKSSLPALINRAVAGEEVIITRHGRPVAELRASTAMPPPGDRAAAFARMTAERITLPAGSPTAVELLNQIYEQPGSRASISTPAPSSRSLSRRRRASR